MSIFNKSAGPTTSLFKRICALPAALMAMIFSTNSFAAATDLLAGGDATVEATLGSDATIWKWVLLGEVATAAVLYTITKKFSVLSGVIIIAVFINVGLIIAGY